MTLAYCAIPVIVFSRGIGEDRCLGRGAITEDECVELFRRHAGDCEDLRRVALGDTTRRRRHDDLPMDPMSVAERQRLLDRIGAYDVRTPRLASGEGIDCEIRVGYWGNFFRARHMSFVFAPSGTSPPANERRHEWFRPLGGGWFLRHRMY